MKNDTFDPTVQVVQAGMAIALDEMTLKYGILLIHPEMPVVRLKLNWDDIHKKIASYAFEAIKPDGPHIKEFSFKIVTPEDDAQPKVILTNGG